MHSRRLLRSGDSVYLPVPPALLKRLGLQSGMAVYMVVDGTQLIVEALPRPRFAFEQLLAQCDLAAELGAEDRE